MIFYIDEVLTFILWLCINYETYHLDQKKNNLHVGIDYRVGRIQIWFQTGFNPIVYQLEWWGLFKYNNQGTKKALCFTELIKVKVI